MDRVRGDTEEQIYFTYLLQAIIKNTERVPQTKSPERCRTMGLCIPLGRLF